MLEGKQTAVARLGSGVPYVTNDAQTKQIPKFGRKEDPFVQVIRAKVHLLTNQSRLLATRSWDSCLWPDAWPEAVTLTSKMNNLKDDQLLVKRKVEVQRIKAKK